MLRVIFILLLVLCLSIAWARSSEPIEIETNSQTAVRDAEFAVTELSKLSDSDIYSTISLKNILYAATQEGIFHYNTLLTLLLSSPYFKSGKPYEEFKMVVMLHKEDGVRALAIDEFPVMDDDAIEKFYIEKVERKRRQREESFRRLEIEAHLLGQQYTYVDVSSEDKHKGDTVDGKTINELLSELDSTEARQARERQSEHTTQVKLNGQYLAEEQTLSKKSLVELYEMVTDQRPATDFQKYRARTVLDAAMHTLNTKSEH